MHLFLKYRPIIRYPMIHIFSQENISWWLLSKYMDFKSEDTLHVSWKYILWDFCEVSCGARFWQVFDKFTMNQPQTSSVQDLEHVLREIEFHNSGSAATGAYMMFKGATSRTDVSSTSSNPFGLSVCLLYSLQTISGLCMCPQVP